MFDVPATRPARPDDLPAITRIVDRAYRGETARVGWTHEADLMEDGWSATRVLGAIAADPVQRLLLAEREGITVGCVAIRNLGEGLVHLGQLCVDPPLQGRGIGRRLIAAAEAHARTSFDVDRIEMVVIAHRVELLAWYARRGYAETGETRAFERASLAPLPMVVVGKLLEAKAEAA